MKVFEEAFSQSKINMFKIKNTEIKFTFSYMNRIVKINDDDNTLYNLHSESERLRDNYRVQMYNWNSYNIENISDDIERDTRRYSTGFYNSEVTFQ